MNGLIFKYGAKTNLELLKDGERLLVEFSSDSNVSDIRGVVVVQTGDVLHNLGLVRLYGGEDEEVLQVGVVGEGAVLQVPEQIGQILKHWNGN